MSEIEIRLCKTWDECLECEELQKRVWEMPDYRDVVPANLLITAVKNGGLLVGAFDGKTMVGFVFGFLGSELRDGARRLKHTSHMLGVIPDVRTKGLGKRLKWCQRMYVLRQGLDFMTWTYDPLQAVNALLNLANLGAIARRYYRNTYGEMTDALNAGVASDRFEVEWYLESERVKHLENAHPSSNFASAANSIYTVAMDGDALPRITSEMPLESETVLVDIPPDYNRMKKLDRALAIEWRARTRDTFERAFAQGYVAHSVERQGDGAGNARVAYVLSRNLALPE